MCCQEHFFSLLGPLWVLSQPCRSCSCVVSCHVFMKLFYEQIKWRWTLRSCCLDDKSDDYQNCSVLCCVSQLCTVITLRSRERLHTSIFLERELRAVSLVFLCFYVCISLVFLCICWSVPLQLQSTKIDKTQWYHKWSQTANGSRVRNGCIFHQFFNGSFIAFTGIRYLCK